MEYKLADLLDIPKLQALFDSLDKLHQLPSAVIDMEGNILTATAWQDICTKFHRVNPQSEKECIKSDTHFVKELSKGKTQVMYKCPQGLVDTATPIVVDGKHLGNAFTGQFFLKPPDEKYYRKLAQKYGFDEEAYIEAMKKVPIITEDRHRKNLEVLARLTETLAEIGLHQKRQLEVEQYLRESRESFKALVEFTKAIHWELDLSTNKFTYVSPQMEIMLGLSPDSWTTFEQWAETVHPEDRDYAIEYCSTAIARGEDHSFIYRVVAADGRIVWLHDIVKVILSAGKPVKLIGIMLDISEQKMNEEKLDKLNSELTASLKEKEILLKEVHHRVKNNMAIISSLLSLQSTYISDDKYIQVFKESQGRIRAMAMVHEMLYQQEQFASINVRDYLSSLLKSVQISFSSTTQIKFHTDIDAVRVNIDTLIPCGLIVNELLTNSLKHAFNGQDDPVITLSLKQIDDNKLQLKVSDNGIGLHDGFDLNAEAGLGLKLVGTLISQLDGTLEVKSANGSEFTITFTRLIELAGSGDVG